MNIKAAPPVIPAQFPALGLLGLRAAGADWHSWRGLQYAQLPSGANLRLLIQLFASVTVAGLYVHLVPLWEPLVWLAALAASLVFTAKCERDFSDAERRPPLRNDMQRHALAVCGNAALWAVPIFAFGPHGTEQSRLELWTILAMLMTVSAVIIPTVPLGTLLFSSVVGGTMAADFVLSGNRQLAVIVLTFAIIVTVGALKSSRAFLASRLAAAGMAERNEVVSLLLKESEEDDADWLWQMDSGRRVRGVNRRFAYALGREPEECEGQSFFTLIAGPHTSGSQAHNSLTELANQIKRREAFTDLLVRVTINDQQRWWELSGKPKFADDGQYLGFHGVGSDVTEARESSDKIAWLARYDALTGLPNRLMLTEAMAEAMRYAHDWRTRCAFLMIDLDRFKSVNDTLGHLVGDQLLASVSERLKSLTVAGETCGRLGGDEFAIVIRDAADLNRVTELARAVIRVLSEPYTIDNHTLYVGASVGSAIGPRDGNTVQMLMRNADLALYRGKEEGGGHYHTYEPGLHAQAEERRKLEASLRVALSRGEFQLHYQPVVDSNTETVTSFEALLRWNSKDHGQVSPAKFVPIAEDTHLIVPIGEWVLREACHEAMRWPRHVKVAVNVSGEQLLSQNFLNSVVTALSTSGLPPQRLEIEVTESIFVRDATTARAALERVMGLGCSVALDDFGTGYSSLGYLRTLRFSTIKVDRSFVQSAATGNRESVAIIRAVVAMADSLEMSTTAEGVETEHELALVREHGCKKIQGYYFGRPMPADDALALFHEARNIDLAKQARLR